MFTGIVSDIGIVEERLGTSDLCFRIAPQRPEAPFPEIGASMACNGVCLTIVENAPDHRWFKVNVSQETLNCTTIGKWHEGQRVNLERPLRVGDELGGHIVSGHVDGITEIESIEPVKDSQQLTCRIPEGMEGFLAAKGSVTLNGVSLTINTVTQTHFTVNLIPHTLSVTTWGGASQGDCVNIEIDVLARYIARFREVAGDS